MQRWQRYSRYTISCIYLVYQLLKTIIYWLVFAQYNNQSQAAVPEATFVSFQVTITSTARSSTSTSEVSTSPDRIMSLNRSVTGIMQPSRYSHTSGTDDPQQRQDSLDLPPSFIFLSRDDIMILSSLHQQKQALCPEGDLQAVIAFSSDLSVQSDERVG